MNKFLQVCRPALPVIFILTMVAAGPLEMNRAFIDAAARVKPSVVNINIYRETVEDGKRVLAKTGFGSGTIITRDGYVVTNNHVVRKGNRYQVVLHDGTECDVEPFADGKPYVADQKTDIALLKINAEDLPALVPAAFGDSDLLEEGEWVIAVGNPYGLRLSITTGIVSSKGRSDIGFADIEDFIQTDVPINPGNSGGPLVNLRGELVGINTAIRTVSGGYQGISFAIPSNIVRQACYELMRFGRIRRGWLGFLAREKKVAGKGEKNLIEVMSVIKDSPAELSGLMSGDVIREIDSKRIVTLGELVKAVGNKQVGSTLKLTVSRDGHLLSFEYPLREKDDYGQSPGENRSLFSTYGLELSENARSNEVVVSYVSPLGAAYQYGVKSGDVVRSLNGGRVTKLNEFMNIFRRNGSRIERLDVARDTRMLSISFSGRQE